MIKRSQVDLWGSWHDDITDDSPALAKRVVRCRVMIWISMGTASVFPCWTKSPDHDHISEIITFLVHVRTPLLKPAFFGGKTQKKIVSFNCKTAAIQRLVTGAYGSISHECLTCPYFGRIFIAIRYLIMLGFFPRFFHILVSQLRRCFCSASPSEKHIISNISSVHKYEKKLSILCMTSDAPFFILNIYIDNFIWLQ